MIQSEDKRRSSYGRHSRESQALQRKRRILTTKLIIEYVAIQMVPVTIVLLLFIKGNFAYSKLYHNKMLQIFSFVLLVAYLFSNLGIVFFPRCHNDTHDKVWSICMLASSAFLLSFVCAFAFIQVEIEVVLLGFTVALFFMSIGILLGVQRRCLLTDIPKSSLLICSFLFAISDIIILCVYFHYVFPLFYFVYALVHIGYSIFSVAYVVQLLRRGIINRTFSREIPIVSNVVFITAIDMFSRAVTCTEIINWVKNDR